MTEAEFQVLEEQIRRQHRDNVEVLITYLRSKLVKDEVKKEPPK